jgi:hypothetical protein
MPAAYVLVQAEPGSVPDVLAAMRTLSEVAFVEAVTGPYDAVVAVAGGQDAGPVRRRLQETPGVARTLTCPSVAA